MNQSHRYSRGFQMNRNIHLTCVLVGCPCMGSHLPIALKYSIPHERYR